MAQLDSIWVVFWIPRLNFRYFSDSQEPTRSRSFAPPRGTVFEKPWGWLPEDALIRLQKSKLQTSTLSLHLMCRMTWAMVKFAGVMWNVPLGQKTAMLILSWLACPPWNSRHVWFYVTVLQFGPWLASAHRGRGCEAVFCRLGVDRKSIRNTQMAGSVLDAILIHTLVIAVPKGHSFWPLAVHGWIDECSIRRFFESQVRRKSKGSFKGWLEAAGWGVGWLIEEMKSVMTRVTRGLGLLGPRTTRRTGWWNTIWGRFTHTEISNPWGVVELAKINEDTVAKATSYDIYLLTR